VKARPQSLLWLQAGGQVVIHGSSKREGRWVVKVVALQAIAGGPGLVEEVIACFPDPDKRSTRTTERA
jgi:hypothetical protein